jgi:hypothetical protein
MFQTKVVVKIKTHVIRSIFFFLEKSCQLTRKCGKCGTAGQTRDENIWRMRYACWITKSINTNSKYVILIDFPHQQQLRERASVLCFHVHCLSCFLVRVDSCVGNGGIVLV